MSSDTVNVASDIVFADGSVLNGLVGADMLALAARPNSRISVPLVGDLILNEQKIDKHSSPHGNQVTVTVNALHLVLDGILGHGDITVAQSVCRAGGKGIGKDLKVVSTTNGNDTSDQVGEGDDDGDGGGLLDGVLGGGDGGLLDVNHLLGGGLLTALCKEPESHQPTEGGGLTTSPLRLRSFSAVLPEQVVLGGRISSPIEASRSQAASRPRTRAAGMSRALPMTSSAADATSSATATSVTWRGRPRSSSVPAGRPRRRGRPHRWRRRRGHDATAGRRCRRSPPPPRRPLRP